MRLPVLLVLVRVLKWAKVTSLSPSKVSLLLDLPRLRACWSR
jgi:hypothetical protein